MSNNAAAAREQANLLSVYRNSMANVSISRAAQVGTVEAERSYSTSGAQNTAAREQGQVLLDKQISQNTNDQMWWSYGTETLGGVGGIVAGGAGGAAPGSSLGRTAARPGEIVTDQVNIDTRAMGGISLSSQYMGRTSENNRNYADTRTEIEQTRATAQENAITEQYQGQSGAVSAWQQNVNSAANTQAGIASQAAQESTSMLNEAAGIKLAGTESAISQVRAAGLQAAEYHRMAQIISQVTHDMTRRIEEMGQYRF